MMEASTKSKEPKPRDLNLPAASQPSNEAKESNKVTFLTLPVEIRLQIYDLLLVSRFDRRRAPSCSVGYTDQRKVFLSMEPNPVFRTLETAILQTCKQINHEANPVLYSQNVFAIVNPEEIFRLIQQIGPVKFKLIRTLDILVPWMAEPPPWLRLLPVLAEDANGLRDIKLTWDAIDQSEYRWRFKQGVSERGLGDNLDFVRALGKIKGLEKLVIEGCYAKNWPAYLEERMGVRVQTIDQRRDEHEMRLKGAPEHRIKSVREANEKRLRELREYQRGTEGLIP
jgi:hypothetical protein